MFGFGHNDSPAALARKKSYMKDAQHEWPFLTEYDLWSIRTEGELCSLVKIRSNISVEKAKKDVGVWMQGKKF